MDEFPSSDCEVDYLPQKFCVKICSFILQNALDQLTILKMVFKMPEMQEVYESYKTTKERYSEEVIKTTKEENMNKEERHLLNFHKNFALVETALKTTADELLKHGSFEKLLNIINVWKMLKSDEDNLRMDTVRKQSEVKKLDHTLYTEKLFYHKKIEECMVNIGKVKDEIEELMTENEIKNRYIKDWQHAKMEQNQMKLKLKEKAIINVLRRIEADIFRELRINEEVESVLNEMQEELRQQINLWEAKYNTHIKEINFKINALQEKQEIQQDATNKLKDVFTQRQKEIDDYKQYKIEQEKRRVELEMRNKAATKIQAWWRGTMVRKGFGRFRKKDKKGKKGSSEKKNKNAK